VARSPDEQRAYDEGVLAERLSGFDRHFAAINGSIADTAAALKAVEKAIIVAAAKQEERDRALILAAREQTTGLTKAQVLVGGIGLAVAIIFFALRAFHIGG